MRFRQSEVRGTMTRLDALEPLFILAGFIGLLK